MKNREIMTIEEVAEYLRVSERTVYDWAQKGEIPGGKIGTSWRFKRSEVMKWIDKQLGSGYESAPPPPVDLSQVLTPQRCLIMSHETKTDAFNELIDVLSEAPEIESRNELAQAIFNREQLMSTGIGLGIGLPHVRLASISDLVMACGINRFAIEDYASIDDEPIWIIIMIAANDNQHAQYIRFLSHISARLKKPSIREGLQEAETSETVYRLLTQAHETVENKEIGTE
jgi:PTS system nitrogen regulatory IIA component